MAGDTLHVRGCSSIITRSSPHELVRNGSNVQDATSSTSFGAPKMSRSDSGYEELPTTRRSRSTSSSQPHSGYSSSSSSRPSDRRARTSSAKYVRPSFQSRQLSVAPSVTSLPIHEFFQFPLEAGTPDLTFSPSSQAVSHTSQPALELALPPPTVCYWLSPDSRKSEYAAIDAASNGLRGMLIRLLPACVVPREHRRRKLYDPMEDCDDNGSVRRFRLCMDDEKAVVHVGVQHAHEEPHRRSGLFRRLSSRTDKAKNVA